MTVHCLHIFDHKGKTLFTKTYSASARKQQQQLVQGAESDNPGAELDEQRKLVFGMLFSLREIMGSLDPDEDSCECRTDPSDTTREGFAYSIYTYRRTDVYVDHIPKLTDTFLYVNFFLICTPISISIIKCY